MPINLHLVSSYRETSLCNKINFKKNFALQEILQCYYNLHSWVQIMLKICLVTFVLHIVDGLFKFMQLCVTVLPDLRIFSA